MAAGVPGQIAEDEAPGVTRIHEPEHLRGQPQAVDLPAALAPGPAFGVVGEAFIARLEEPKGDRPRGRVRGGVRPEDGANLAAALPAGPWLVKVNAREAADALGLPATDEAGAVGAARQLTGRGATIALVTRGTAGAILRDERGGAWRIGPPPELGPYAVGSGDALLAGLAAALARGTTLPEAARHGCAAACANAIRPGQGELDPVDATRVLPGISLEELPGEETTPWNEG